MSIVLDKGLLFGGPATGEIIAVDNFVRNETSIEVDGVRFRHGNIDRHTCGGYAVPRSYPTTDEYPHWILEEGFWHPETKNAVRKAYSC